MSEAESDRRDKVESYVLFATADVGEALTDIETALKFADPPTRERLQRAKAALLGAAAHLDVLYPKPDAGESVRVLRQP